MNLLNPFRSFLFSPSIGIDGRPFGASKIELQFGVPWFGRGSVRVEACLKSEFTDILKINHPIQLAVNLYHTRMHNDKPDGMIVLYNVIPDRARVSMTALNAMDDDVVLVAAEMDYDRLTFIEGNNPLDKIMAAVI